MKYLGSYHNGNYKVYMFDDGTKIRANKLTSLEPDFPESIDMKICNRCGMGCPQCHECSTPDGDLANLNHPILNSLSPLTELALGGGNVLEHPDLDDFLKRMKDQGVLCNMTVHVDHFISNYDRLLAYSKKKLIHGLGISVNYPVSEAVAASIAKFPNAVVHVIAGIVTPEALEVLYDRDIKLLILGYKDYGRGEGYHAIHPEIETNIEQMKASLQDLADHFAILSFDNLAIKQFDLSSVVPDSVWEMGYMGDDGQFTMYIDLVKEEYAVSSVSPRHPLNEDEIIETVFAKVKKEASLNGGK